MSNYVKRKQEGTLGIVFQWVGDEPFQNSLYLPDVSRSSLEI